jgi:hypothetical protein
MSAPAAAAAAVVNKASSRVVISGSGLAGALEAIFLAKQVRNPFEREHPVLRTLSN